MKTMKRLFALALAVMMLSAFSINAIAADISTEPMPGELEPEYIVSCSAGGKHQMLSLGRGHVYDASGDDHIFSGCLYQCTECYIILVTTGNMLIPTSVWGQYALKDFGWEYMWDGIDLIVETNDRGEKWAHDDFTDGFTFIAYK